MSLKYEPLQQKTTNPSSTATNTPQPLSPYPQQDMPVLKPAATEQALDTIPPDLFFSSLLLSRLELSDTKVYEP